MTKIAKKKKPMGEIIEELRKPPKPSGKTYINGIIKEQKEYKKLLGKSKKKPLSKKSKHKKHTGPKEKYLVSLKREKEMAKKGWNVARTTGYLKKPKKAVGKKGYPYAVLNKKENYETFYTWKEKPSKKKKKRRLK